MPIYTHTGDQGTASLNVNFQDLPKSHPVFSLLGDLDELNSLVGVILSLSPSPLTKKYLLRLQSEIFLLSSEIASPSKPHFRLKSIQVRQLERRIDQISRHLPQLKTFIFSQGTTPATLLFLARTVARRAERSLVSLAKHPPFATNHMLFAYLNRLSDFLFVLARYENYQCDLKDHPWPDPK